MFERDKSQPGSASVPSSSETLPAVKTPAAGVFSPPPRPIFIERGAFTVSLPGGLLIGERVCREVTLEPVTAGDRRTFGDKKNRQNGGMAITKLLMNKVLALDGVPSVKESHIRAMLGFDRDFLVFSLRENLHPGRSFKERFICSDELCRAENDMSVEPEEMVLREMTDAQRRNVDAAKNVLFDVEIPDFGFTGKFRYSTGSDQEHLGRISDGSNVFDLEFELLSRICVEFMGPGPVTVEKLAQADPDFIAELQEVVRKHGRGYEVPQARCYKCDRKQDVQVNPLDFLFGSTKKQLKEAPMKIGA